jgi:hypothetical protein
MSRHAAETSHGAFDASIEFVEGPPVKWREAAAR